MNAWPSVELWKIAKVTMGQSPSGSTYNNENDGLPFLQGEADFGHQFPTVRKWCSEPARIAEVGDILLSVSAPVGPINVAQERSCIGRGLAAIRAKEGRVEQDYLRLFFKHQQNLLALRGQGSIFFSINRWDIEKLDVPLPPPSEQRRIVEIVDKVDRLRRLRSEADYMVDHILTALLIRTLGNPTNWESEKQCKPLGDLAVPVGGATPRKSVKRYWSGDIPWVSPKDMNRDFLTDSQDHISQEALDETNLMVIEPGNTVLVVRGMILERDIPVAINQFSVTVNQDLKALIPRTTDVTGAYIWASLRLAKQRLRQLVRTSTHGTRKLDVPELMRFLIPSPQPERLKQVEAAVKHHQLTLLLRGRSKRSFERLYAVTLSKAFDGSLTSDWHEAHLSDLTTEIKRHAKILRENTSRC